MKTLYDLLRVLNPDLKIDLDKNFLITPQKTFTYHSINHLCNHSAESLRQLGVVKNSLVPLLFDNSPDFMTAVFSLWMLEAVPVPLNIKLSPSEIKTQLDFLKCQNIIVSSLTENIIDNNHLRQINFESLKRDTDDIDLNFTFDENRTAIVLFTSGASGKPKAVELTFSSLINSAKIGNQFLNQSQNDCWLASLPFYHIGGFSIIFRSLMFGTQLILPNDLKFDSLHSVIHSFNPSLISLVSSQMKELLKNNIQPNKNLRHVLLGGGFIDANLMREALSKGWNVGKVYGSTETSSFVTVLSPEEFVTKPESAGKPITPNEVLILDENGEQLPVNIEGEIVVKTPSLMKGYLNDDVATRQKLKDALYFSGDIGYKDEDGYLYVVNRRSDLIVTGGENVNPIEVEEIILKFPKVKEVCVFGVDDEEWGQKIAAAIVTNPNQQFTLEELKVFMKDKVAVFKIPKKIYFVEDFPKTDLGKLMREKVKGMF